MPRTDTIVNVTPITWNKGDRVVYRTAEYTIRGTVKGFVKYGDRIKVLFDGEDSLTYISTYQLRPV